MVKTSAREIVKGKKKICASFAVTPQAAEAVATVGGTRLVRKEKALNLWVEAMSRKRAQIDSRLPRQHGAWRGLEPGPPGRRTPCCLLHGRGGSADPGIALRFVISHCHRKGEYGAVRY